MESLPAVLIVDDDRIVLHTMQDQLSRENYRVVAISTVAVALQRLRIERFGIIMADQSMPETPGIEFLRICRESQPLSARMIITGMASLFGPAWQTAYCEFDQPIGTLSPALYDFQIAALRIAIDNVTDFETRRF